MHRLVGMFGRLRRPVSGCLAVLLLVIPAACRRAEPPLRIGFIGALTGRVAGLGIAGHDGVLLAVEERNRHGGVQGRPVELVARDLRQDDRIAVAVTQEMVASDVVAIIGPMTSAMAVVMQPLINQAQVVTVSPTVTANRFSEQDDYFLRVTPPLQVNAWKLADHALRNGHLRVAVAVDIANAAYTEDWLDSFARRFNAGGGRILHVERFRSGAGDGFLELTERLLASGPDALLLLSAAIDTALVAQQVRKLGNRVPLFATEWAFTGEVVSFGGKAVDGMVAFVTYDPASAAPRHQAFVTDFETRFGYRPSFAAVLGYEAATFLLAGLERNPRRQGLKEGLLAEAGFAGLQGAVRINRYGDAERETFLAVIREGNITTNPRPTL